MPFRYYNAHPRGLSVDDCTKRSISLTTGISYKEVQKGLNAHKRVTGAKTFYSGRNPESYMENVLGFSRVAVKRQADGKRIGVEKFAKEHPCGRYVVSMSGHWTACIDGIIYDTWNCGEEGVLSYYPVTRYKRIHVEKKYCFTAREDKDALFVTVYDGNSQFSTKRLDKASGEKYVSQLYSRGFFNFDEIGEYI